MRLVKYRGGDGSEVCGEVVEESTKELKVIQLNARRGSRALFWLPSSSCVPLTDAETSRLLSEENEAQGESCNQAVLAAPSLCLH